LLIAFAISRLGQFGDAEGQRHGFANFDAFERAPISSSSATTLSFDCAGASPVLPIMPASRTVPIAIPMPAKRTWTWAVPEIFLARSSQATSELSDWRSSRRFCSERSAQFNVAASLTCRGHARRMRNLLALHVLRRQREEAGIERVEAGRKGAVIRLHGNAATPVACVSRVAQSRPGHGGPEGDSGWRTDRLGRLAGCEWAAGSARPSLHAISPTNILG
jgi:hypothetical protein